LVCSANYSGRFQVCRNIGHELLRGAGSSSCASSFSQKMSRFTLPRFESFFWERIRPAGFPRGPRQPAGRDPSAARSGLRFAGFRRRFVTEWKLWCWIVEGLKPEINVRIGSMFNPTNGDMNLRHQEHKTPDDGRWFHTVSIQFLCDYGVLCG